MGRKKQNPEESEKRQRIIQVAVTMFMEHGYSTVSMDAIADAAPVSKRTLYNHFKDKKALFTAAMERRCSLLFTTLQKTLQAPGDPAATLTDFGMRFLDLALRADSIHIYRTAITEAFHFPDLGELFYASGPKRSAAILSDYLETLDAAGKLDIPNPMLAATAFMGMLTNRTQMRFMLGVKKHITKAQKQEIVDYAVRVFLYGQQPGG